MGKSYSWKFIGDVLIDNLQHWSFFFFFCFDEEYIRAFISHLWIKAAKLISEGHLSEI